MLFQSLITCLVPKLNTEALITLENHTKKQAEIIILIFKCTPASINNVLNRIRVKIDKII